MDYKQAYFNLFNLITDIEEKLKAAQTEAESIVINENTKNNEDSQNVVNLLPKSNKN